MSITPLQPRSHPLHTYIAGQIIERLRDRHVVVLYDRREELRPFIAELSADAPAGTLVPVLIGTQPAKLCVFAGSFLEIRTAVEPMTGSESPEDVIIYIPGRERDETGSLLMELEKAGTCYHAPALRQFARNVLRRRFTDVAIDGMLRSEALIYADFARMAADDGEGGGPSLLRGMFNGADSQAILVAWLADIGRDAEIEAKGATGELRDVVRARLGLGLPEDAGIARMRSILARHLLANEFRLDLSCPVTSVGALTHQSVIKTTFLLYFPKAGATLAA
jgi:hypothetical protein